MEILIGILIYLALLNIALAKFIYVQHKKTRKELQEIKVRLTNVKKRQLRKEAK